MMWDCATMGEKRVSPIEHVKRVYGQLRVSNTDPLTWVSQFISTLQGAAHLWAEALLADREIDLTWEEMQDRFVSAIPHLPVQPE